VCVCVLKFVVHIGYVETVYSYPHWRIKWRVPVVGLFIPCFELFFILSFSYSFMAAISLSVCIRPRYSKFPIRIDFDEVDIKQNTICCYLVSFFNSSNGYRSMDPFQSLRLLLAPVLFTLVSFAQLMTSTRCITPTHTLFRFISLSLSCHSLHILKGRESPSSISDMKNWLERHISNVEAGPAFPWNRSIRSPRSFPARR